MTVLRIKLLLFSGIIILLSLTLQKSWAQQTQWAVQLGAQDVNAMCGDSHQNIYATGSFIGNVDFDPGPGYVYLPFNPGGNNTYITKMDSLGNLIWAKSIVGSDVISWGVATDSTQSVYIAGLFYSSADFNPDTLINYTLTATNASSGNPDIFVLKLDSLGNFIWAFKIGTGGFESAGNLVVDQSGNIYITGRYDNTCDFDPGSGVANLSTSTPESVYIAKYDSAGQYVWVQAAQLSYYGEYERMAAGYDHNGNIYIANYGEIAKVDTAGNFVFKKSFNNNPVSTQGYCNVTSLSCDYLGNVFVCGYFNDTIDFDTDSTTAFYVNAVGAYNSFVCHLNSSVELVWVRQFTQNSTNLSVAANHAHAILVKDTLVYVGGVFTDTMDVNMPAGVNMLYEVAATPQDDYYDAYVVALTNTGNYAWGESFGGNLLDRSTTLCASDDAVYVAGQFSDTADFNNSPLVQTLMFNGVGNFNVFVLKFNAPAITTIKEIKSEELQYFVYPVPVKKVLYFSENILKNFYTFSVKDIAGREIIHSKLMSGKLNVDALSNGVYIIEFFKSNNENFKAKFIKE